MNIKLLLEITNQSINWMLPEMHSVEAIAMLVAIALQESNGTQRRQHGGPGRGYWQFEPNGALGVAKHPQTALQFENLCTGLDYPASAGGVAADIEKDTILAACVARLLLYTHPDPLPRRGNADGAWRQYLDLWRPGKPRPADWAANWDLAWTETTGTADYDSADIDEDNTLTRPEESETTPTIDTQPT